MEQEGFPKRKAPKPVLPPPDEVPVQMSPFSDDRWDLDLQENRRRKELQREYVYNYRKATPPAFPAPETAAATPEDPVAPSSSEPVEKYQAPSDAPPEPSPKDYFKCEPQQLTKSWNDIKFETPAPPDLYPVLKFPEKRIKPESLYRPGPKSNLYLPPVAVADRPPEVPVLPHKPQFAVYRDIKPQRPSVEHYGVCVPFWEFK